MLIQSQQRKTKQGAEEMTAGHLENKKEGRSGDSSSTQQQSHMLSVGWDVGCWWMLGMFMVSRWDVRGEADTRGQGISRQMWENEGYCEKERQSTRVHI